MENKPQIRKRPSIYGNTSKEQPVKLNYK